MTPASTPRLRHVEIAQAILTHPQPLTIAQMERAYILACHPLAVFLSPAECADLAIARVLEGR
jgi:hypothetical protein